ncbi:MAG: aldose epimerase [Sphingomonas bacterium]|uniref:aldose 1-epimerase family protein n=1 Tax=Sphingomonas bacterium TaxID=1895847 RepID=UPI002639D858|nr:aldose 1-epimerase family protein [Sphingomonas bacterium]MDB5695700.1 aldose epimerase [Sphingomonas bacterium]
MNDWITITSGVLTAAINPFGAELSSLADADGRELMTDADPAFWTGRAPLLFPVVGKVAGDVIRVGGREYPMEKHGFARRLPFTVETAEATRAVFALEDSAATRAQYPYAFRLEVAFSLADASLRVDVTIANTGDRPMPASFGFHPAFAWPLPYGQPRDAHRITFADDAPGPVKQLAEGLIAGDRPSPLHGRTLVMNDALFTRDALIWDPVPTQSLTYGAEPGPQLRIDFPDTPQLGIWSKPGARFVCIEPWHGLADPQGHAGEFRDKPGVLTLAAGASKHVGMTVTLLP